MRKLSAIGLAAVFILSIPAAAMASHVPPDSCKTYGGGAFFYSGDCVIDSIGPGGPYFTFYLTPGQAGEIFADSTLGPVCSIGPANVTGATDTVCVEFQASGDAGGTYSQANWDCFELGSGLYSPDFILAEMPCDAVPGERDTVTVLQKWCIEDTCQTSCPAEDAFTIYVEIVAAPPAIAVLCPDTAYAEAGVANINVPFDICNPDPCADTSCYDYSFTASSNVGGLTSSGSGEVNVGPGDCERILVNLDGTLAVPGDTSAIEMIASTPCPAESAVAFDTCFTFLIIVEPAENVPLFSTPVAAILILSLVLMAAGVLRRRALAS
jgi:hypothetical protein